MIKKILPLALLGAISGSPALADGMVVDKVYHPYVLANERKLEWRFMSRQDSDGNLLSQRIGYGQALSENFILEGYIIGERDDVGNFGLQAIELEGRWMLTEQGQYWADWGVLFEVEKAEGEDRQEASAGLMFEKEYGRNSLTLNTLLIYEWGNALSKDEFETEFRLQYRFRWIPELQPAVEIYTGEDYVGIGPSLMGVYRYQGQKQLKYELGFISGLNGKGKDHTLRFALEWEF